MAATETVLDRPQLRAFLLGLAEGMTAAGESVDKVHTVLEKVVAAYGETTTNIVVLPTVILVQTGGATDARVAISSQVGASLRFDQIATLYALVHKAEAGEVDPADGIRQLNAIGVMKPRFGWLLRTLGHAVLTTGLALLLFPTWQGLILAFGLGLLIGLMKLVRSPTLNLVFPIVAAFICALVVFWLAEPFASTSPLTLLIAPLVTFLPGGVLTTATVELAAGQMIAGASRLVMGMVQLLLLAFGIIAAGTLLGVSTLTYSDTDATPPLGWWAPLLGVLLFAIGNYLHFSAPGSTFGWVLLCLLIAYGGQLAGAALFGASLSGFFGALVVTPVVLWIDSLRRGAPSQLVFLPAFWLLVPGASGLIGVTEAVGADMGLRDFAAAMTTVVSIALGVLIGTALFRSVRFGARELESFHIDLPAALAPAPGNEPFWKRLLPGRSKG